MLGVTQKHNYSVGLKLYTVEQVNSKSQRRNYYLYWYSSHENSFQRVTDNWTFAISL